MWLQVFSGELFWDLTLRGKSKVVHIELVPFALRCVGTVWKSSIAINPTSISISESNLGNGRSWTASSVALWHFWMTNLSKPVGTFVCKCEIIGLSLESRFFRDDPSRKVSQGIWSYSSPFKGFYNDTWGVDDRTQVGDNVSRLDRLAPVKVNLINRYPGEQTNVQCVASCVGVRERSFSPTGPSRPIQSFPFSWASRVLSVRAYQLSFTLVSRRKGNEHMCTRTYRHL